MGLNEIIYIGILWALKHSVQFKTVQLLSCVRLFATPWMAVRQASLSITNSQSLLKPMFIESVMPTNHLILSILLPTRDQRGIFTVRFSSVHSLGRVRHFATPWTEAHQASLSITSSQSWLKLMSIKSVMPSNHFILCCPLLLLPSVFPSIRVFSNESVLRIR